MDHFFTHEGSTGVTLWAEIRAEEASLGFCLPCRLGWVVSVRGCGEDPGPGRPGHLPVLGLQPDSDCF